MGRAGVDLSSGSSGRVEGRGEGRGVEGPGVGGGTGRSPASSPAHLTAHLLLESLRERPARDEAWQLRQSQLALQEGCVGEAQGVGKARHRAWRGAWCSGASGRGAAMRGAHV